MLAEIRDAGDRAHAVAAVDAFAAELATSWPKAVARIVGDAEPLLAFYDLPAEHWINLALALARSRSPILKSTSPDR